MWQRDMFEVCTWATITNQVTNYNTKQFVPQQQKEWHTTTKYMQSICIIYFPSSIIIPLMLLHLNSVTNSNINPK